MPRSPGNKKKNTEDSSYISLHIFMFSFIVCMNLLMCALEIFTAELGSLTVSPHNTHLINHLTPTQLASQRELSTACSACVSLRGRAQHQTAAEDSAMRKQTGKKCFTFITR